MVKKVSLCQIPKSISWLLFPLPLMFRVTIAACYYEQWKAIAILYFETLAFINEGKGQARLTQKSVIAKKGCSMSAEAVTALF